MHVVNPLYGSTSPFPELVVSSFSPCCNPYRMLTVEPLPFSSLVQELHQPPQLVSTASLSCPVQHSLHGYHPRHPFRAPTAQMGIRGSNILLGLVLRRTTTLVHRRQSADWARIYFPRGCHHVGSTTRSRARVYFFSVPLSMHIVVQAQTQNSPYSQCMPNYCVTRLRSTCFIVRVCARWDCGEHMGGGSCTVSQTPCQWRHSGDTFTTDDREHGKLAYKWHDLAFGF